MPSSKRVRKSSSFRDVSKICEVCGVQLKLNNSRDIVRKKYCSESCKGKSIRGNVVFGEKYCSECGKQFIPMWFGQYCCSTECNSAKQLKSSYKMMNGNPEKYFKHALYKRGREALSVEFMLDLLNKQGGRCAISGKKLTFIKIPNSGRTNTNASIDQIVAGGGYTEDNVQIVCDVVNRMKTDMTMDELRYWCAAILED